jgi:dynein heavy chain
MDEEGMADWQMKGVPSETVSIENMIIMHETKQNKCPVFIDPQG